jgi:hypothetical protein
MCSTSGARCVLALALAFLLAPSASGANITIGTFALSATDAIAKALNLWADWVSFYRGRFSGRITLGIPPQDPSEHVWHQARTLWVEERALGPGAVCCQFWPTS